MIIVFNNDKLEQTHITRLEAMTSLEVITKPDYGFVVRYMNLAKLRTMLLLGNTPSPTLIPTAIAYAEALNLACIYIDENFGELFSELEEEVNTSHLQIGSKIYRNRI